MVAGPGISANISMDGQRLTRSHVLVDRQDFSTKFIVTLQYIVQKSWPMVTNSLDGKPSNSNSNTFSWLDWMRTLKNQQTYFDFFRNQIQQQFSSSFFYQSIRPTTNNLWTFDLYNTYKDNEEEGWGKVLKDNIYL